MGHGKFQCRTSSSNGVKADELENLLKITLNRLQEIGLHVLATVCDQATVNRKVYSSLGVLVEYPDPVFIINNQKFTHCTMYRI